MIIVALYVVLISCINVTSACLIERTSKFAAVLQSLKNTTRVLPSFATTNYDIIASIWRCEDAIAHGQRSFCAAKLLPQSCTMAVAGGTRDTADVVGPCKVSRMGSDDLEPGQLKDVDVLEVSSQSWIRSKLLQRLCPNPGFSPHLLLLHLPLRKLPPIDELAIWAAGCKLMLYDKRMADVPNMATLSFISWEWAHRDFDAVHGCQDPQPRRHPEPFPAFLEEARSICPASAPPVCPQDPSYMPSQAKRRRQDLPAGCPIVPDTQPRSGFGNHLGLMFSYAALGRLLQRPVVIYFYTNNDVCMNKEGFGNLSRLTTLGSSWGGLYYLEKEDHQAAYNSAPDRDRLVFPPFDSWPDPKHSVDLLSETVYVLFRKTGILTRFPSSARLWRCLSPERWLWHFGQAGRAFKLRVDLGLPPPRSYVALYIRRQDKGDIGPKRTEELSATLREVVHAMREMGVNLPWMVLCFDTRYRDAILHTLHSCNTTFHPYTMSDSEKKAREMPGYDYDSVRLMQDFFLMARAGGLLSSCPWGNPTFSTGAHWTAGGLLPYFSADPRPPEGQNWQHQQLAKSVFQGGMQKWWFYPNHRPFLEAVRQYAQGGR